jgi:hypothetical protein
MCTRPAFVLGPLVAAVLGVAAAALVAPACKPGWTATDVARTGLTVAQQVCVWRTAVTDDKTMADACGIADALIPALRSLLGTKAVAGQAGALRPSVVAPGAPGSVRPIDTDPCALGPWPDAGAPLDAGLEAGARR